MSAQEKYCVSYKDVPLAVGAIFEMPQAIWFGMVATDELDKKRRHWVFLTKAIKQAFKEYKHLYLSKRRLVEVWEQHGTSVRWLEMMGFERSDTSREVNGETMIVMELK